MGKNKEVDSPTFQLERSDSAIIFRGDGHMECHVCVEDGEADDSAVAVTMVIIMFNDATIMQLVEQKLKQVVKEKTARTPEKHNEDRLSLCQTLSRDPKSRTGH